MSIYALKPKFQALLRPLVTRLAQAGVTANQITLLACLLSILLGAFLVWQALSQQWLAFVLLPVWMFIRMGLNAVDGMLAREFGQKSALGAYLNEITDVVADAALYLPFAFLAPWALWPVIALIWLAALSEYAGALGVMVGASRRYEGPLGKSDRAFFFGCWGLWLGIFGVLPNWMLYVCYGCIVLLLFTIIRRIQAGLQEVKSSQSA